MKQSSRHAAAILGCVTLICAATGTATTWGGKILGIDSGDHAVGHTFCGQLILARADGGWAVTMDVPDGGFDIYVVPVPVPPSQLVNLADAGWVSETPLRDGGVLRTPAKPSDVLARDRPEGGPPPCPDRSRSFAEEKPDYGSRIEGPGRLSPAYRGKPPPTEAWRSRGEDGTIAYRCTLTAQGELADCRITKSLRFMDEVVLQWLAHERWSPGTKDGQPVESTILGAFEYKHADLPKR